MITINTHGADISASDATVYCNGVENIERKTRGVAFDRKDYIEIETDGGTVEFHDLPEDVMAALVAISDLIHK